jgi:hypothetical protein
MHGAAGGGVGGGGDGADAAELYDRLVREVAATDLHVPTTTADGRALPEPVRVFYYIQHHRRWVGWGGGRVPAVHTGRYDVRVTRPVLELLYR